MPEKVLNYSRLGFENRKPNCKKLKKNHAKEIVPQNLFTKISTSFFFYRVKYGISGTLLIFFFFLFLFLFFISFDCLFVFDFWLKNMTGLMTCECCHFIMNWLLSFNSLINHNASRQWSTETKMKTKIKIKIKMN